MKINRNYEILITLENGDIIEINFPLTIKFNAVRTIDSTLNTLDLDIYNLSLKTRNLIFKERTNIGIYKKLVLKAGYGKKLRTIFIGNILESYSSRQNTDIITNIFCQDGGFALQNSFSNFTLKSGNSIVSGVKKLFSDLLEVESGVTGDEIKEKTHKRGVTYSGKTFDLLQKETGDKVFIDLSKVNVLGENECIQGSLPSINSSTGLLNTPRRRGAYLEVDVLFSPEITVGQLIALESATNPIFDGQYKVIGITHDATISGAVCGTAVTTLQLYLGTKLLGGLKIVNE